MALHLKSTGIDFQDFAHAGAAISELLHDYEEGTWTMNANGGYITIATQNSTHYLKIAHLVQLNVYVGLAANGDGNAITFGNMPFNAESYHCVCLVNMLSGYVGYVHLRTKPNEAVMDCYKPNQVPALENEVDNSHFIYAMNYKLYV